MNKYLNTLSIIGCLVIIVIVISLFAFPSWIDQPGGVFLLVAAAITGVLTAIKGFSDAHALFNKKDEAKLPEVKIQVVTHPLPEGAGDVLRKTSVKNNLPQPSYGKFIGREKEIDLILKTLRPYPQSQFHLVTIDGVGGVGKSTLALEVATRYLFYYEGLPPEERFDAIVWVSAKQTYLTTDGILKYPKGFKDLHDLCTSIMIVLQSKPIPKDMAEIEVELVKNELTNQRTLILVDNLETVDDEEVINFLNNLPAPTKAIITTRHWLPTSVQIKLAGMDEKDAMLFLQTECDKKEVSLQKDTLIKIYSRTGGVPLAMLWSIGQISNGLTVEDVLQRLGEPTGDIVKFCFAGTMKLIRNKPASILLFSLALFENGAQRDALGFVSDLSTMDRDEGLVMLDKLSLINKTGDIFTMLPITREFARSELENSRDIKQRLETDFKDWGNLILLRELLPYQAKYWVESAARGFEIPLGKGIDGQRVQLHIGSDVGVNSVLIYGKTSAGKTNLLVQMILLLSLKYHPDEINIYIFGPDKDLLLSFENDLPHLKVISSGEPGKISAFLERINQEMNNRFNLFESRNLESFETYRRYTDRSEKLPRVVVVIDEIFSILNPSNTEQFMQLFRKSRAMGVNFILSSQIDFRLSKMEDFIDARIFMLGSDRLPEVASDPSLKAKLREVKRPGEAILLARSEPILFRKAILSKKISKVYQERIQQLTREYKVKTHVDIL